ncbi:MAG: very short patch repair endonuclease [Pseudomonadota bacterium]
MGNGGSCRLLGQKNTKRLRRLPHGPGYCFSVHSKDLPEKPDIAFTRCRGMIFVYGCFCHGHKPEGCPDGRPPRSNTGYWNQKLDRNAERDHTNYATLERADKDVLTVWACETRDGDALSGRLIAFLGALVTEVAERGAED